MKNITRLSALLLALVLTISCLSACDGFGNQGNSQADENLQTDVYTVTTEIKFATDDNKMKDAVNGMNSTLVTNVDHDNFKIAVDAATGNASVNNEYILVDGVLYHAISLTLGEFTSNSYKKATFDVAEKEDILYNYGAASLDIDYFLTQDLYEGANSKTYTCTDINDEALKGLDAMYSARLSSLGGSVEIANVEYIVEYASGRVTSSTLSISFVISIDGTSYTVIMRQYSGYDYTNQQSVTAPENADSYTEVSYEDIIG